MFFRTVVLILVAAVAFLTLTPVGNCTSDVTIDHFDANKTVYERGDLVNFTLTIRNNALNVSHVIRYQFQIRRGEIVLWQSLASDPQKLNATSELTVRLIYGPLDNSFSDDYYVFRALVYPDDLGGSYISEDYGASVVPEFSWSLMILSTASFLGVFVAKTKPSSRGFVRSTLEKICPRSESHHV